MQGECFIKLSQCGDNRRLGFEKVQLSWFGPIVAVDHGKKEVRKPMIDK
jgi:hypothetical protein